jgi:hypothetical protein
MGNRSSVCGIASSLRFEPEKTGGKAGFLMRADVSKIAVLLIAISGQASHIGLDDMFDPIDRM